MNKQTPLTEGRFYKPPADLRYSRQVSNDREGDS
jgi:hypothetical protein